MLAKTSPSPGATTSRVSPETEATSCPPMMWCSAAGAFGFLRVALLMHRSPGLPVDKRLSHTGSMMQAVEDGCPPGCYLSPSHDISMSHMRTSDVDILFVPGLG